MTPINSLSNTQYNTTQYNTTQRNTINLPVQKPAPLIDSVYLSERGVKLSKESATVHEPNNNNNNNNSSTFNPGITVKPGKVESYPTPDTDEPDGEFIELQYDKDGALSAMFFGKDNWTDDMMATVNRAEGYFFNDMKQAIEDSIMSGFDGDKVYEDALKKGMSEEEALEFKEKEYENHKELAELESHMLAYEFGLKKDAPLSSIHWSALDEDLNFRGSYEYTPEEYESALQDLLDKAMEYAKSDPDEYRASSGTGIEFKVNFEIKPWK